MRGRDWWAQLGSNQRPSGYAYYYSFHCLCPLRYRVCSLDCLFSHHQYFECGGSSYSLYTFPPSSGRSEGELGSGLPFPYRRRVPRIWRVTSAGCPTDCPGQINSRCYYWLMKKQSNCSVCGQSLSGQQRQYCSTRCKNKVHQSYDAQKKRGINRKLLLVKQRGGCCSRCGYKRNLSALTFHHVSGKEFKLDMRSLSNRTFNSVLKEVGKCRLVCQNCHAELHNPDLDLKVLSRAGCSNH